MLPPPGRPAAGKVRAAPSGAFGLWGPQWPCGDCATPQPSRVRLFPRLSTGPGAETGSSQEAEMRVDAVPQPASCSLPTTPADCEDRGGEGGHPEGDRAMAGGLEWG